MDTGVLLKFFRRTVMRTKIAYVISYAHIIQILQRCSNETTFKHMQMLGNAEDAIATIFFLWIFRCLVDNNFFLEIHTKFGPRIGW